MSQVYVEYDMMSNANDNLLRLNRKTLKLKSIPELEEIGKRLENMRKLQQAEMGIV